MSSGDYPVLLGQELFNAEDASPAAARARLVAHREEGRLLETIGLGDPGLRFVDDHLARIGGSLAELGQEAPGPEQLRSSLATFLGALAEGAEEHPGGVQPRILIRLSVGPGGDIAIGARRAGSWSRPGRAWVDPEPVPPAQLAEAGRHKSTSRQLYDRLRQRARERGFEEGILRSPSGELLEGSVSSLFGVVGGVLRTAPSSSGVLRGVVRGRLIAAARSLGLQVREEAIVAGELSRLDEAFLTGAGVGVLPLAELVGEGGEVLWSQRADEAPSMAELLLPALG